MAEHKKEIVEKVEKNEVIKDDDQNRFRNNML